MYTTLHDLPEFRQLTGVFEDRSHAGLVLADMLKEFKDSDALVLAVPAGGVPVATKIAAALKDTCCCTNGT